MMIKGAESVGPGDSDGRPDRLVIGQPRCAYTAHAWLRRTTAHGKSGRRKHKDWWLRWPPSSGGRLTWWWWIPARRSGGPVGPS